MARHQFFDFFTEELADGVLESDDDEEEDDEVSGRPLAPGPSWDTPARLCQEGSGKKGQGVGIGSLCVCPSSSGGSVAPQGGHSAAVPWSCGPPLVCRPVLSLHWSHLDHCLHGQASRGEAPGLPGILRVRSESWPGWPSGVEGRSQAQSGA